MLAFIPKPIKTHPAMYKVMFIASRKDRTTMRLIVSVVRIIGAEDSGKCQKSQKENSRQDSPDNGYDLNSEVMLLCHTIAFLDEE